MIFFLLGSHKYISNFQIWDNFRRIIDIMDAGRVPPRRIRIVFRIKQFLILFVFRIFTWFFNPRAIQTCPHICCLRLFWWGQNDSLLLIFIFRNQVIDQDTKYYIYPKLTDKILILWQRSYDLLIIIREYLKVNYIALQNNAL
jgi:hypothetical protein